MERKCKITTLVLLAAGLAIPFFCGCGRPYADALLEDGIRSLRKNDLDRAIRQLGEYVDSYPDDPSGQCNLGIAYMEKGRHEEAVEAFMKADVLCENDVRPRELMAEAFIRAGDWMGARDALDSAREDMPDSPVILTKSALVEYKSGNKTLAESFLKRALELDPEYPPALFDMAVIMEQKSDRKGAVVYLRRYVEFSSDEPASKINEAEIRINSLTGKSVNIAGVKPKPKPKPEPKP